MASVLHFAVLLLTSGLLIMTPANGEQGACCSGWSQFGDQCFMYSPTKMSWPDAESECISSGANLASVHSAEVHSFLKTMLGENAWLGGYDAVEEGEWHWSDGTDFTYTAWNAGEPNNAGGENCLELLALKGLFNDVPCNIDRNFICAKDV